MFYDDCFFASTYIFKNRNSIVKSTFLYPCICPKLTGNDHDNADIVNLNDHMISLELFLIGENLAVYVSQWLPKNMSFMNLLLCFDAPDLAFENLSIGKSIPTTFLISST